MGLPDVADYSLLRELRRSGSGRYYLARPPRRLGLGDDAVVVKVIDGRLDDQMFRRAVRELRAFARVRSEHLVRVLDAGQQGGVFFYATQHFPAGNLGSPARPLSRVETLRALADAARAAHDLHEAGLAHRDIQPANVALVDGGARLGDLGLAQVLQPGLTVTGLGALDSVEFVDPAVLRGASATRSSDVYSLGATLHRALTGRGIFGDLPLDQPLLAVRAVISQQPEVSGDLPHDDADLVAECVDGDPMRRPPTALVLAERLDALVAATSDR